MLSISLFAFIAHKIMKKTYEEKYKVLWKSLIFVYFFNT